MSAHEVKMPWDELEQILLELKSSCDTNDHHSIRKLLLEAPTAFNPTDGICDLNWQENLKNSANVTLLKNVN